MEPDPLIVQSRLQRREFSQIAAAPEDLLRIVRHFDLFGRMAAAPRFKRNAMFAHASQNRSALTPSRFWKGLGLDFPILEHPSTLRISARGNPIDVFRAGTVAICPKLSLNPDPY